MRDLVQSGLAVAALLVAACGGAVGSSPGSVGGGGLPPLGLAEDRVLIGDFSHVLAVAAGQERVWVVTPDAVLGWDHRFREWDGPYPAPGVRALERVRWALVDPLDQSLWLGHPDGWMRWQPDLRMWDAGRVSGVRGIFVDAADPGSGLYLRTTSGWQAVSPGSGLATSSPEPARPVGPRSVEEALRANPSFAATSAGTLLDERMRQTRITSATEAWDRRGWYFGTWGGGVLYVEQGFPSPERLRYGLAGELVGALFTAPGGVWVATDRSPDAEAALTFVGSQLDRFEVVTGGPASGLPFTAAREIIGHGDALWVATDAGVARVDPGDDRVQVVDQSRGLPDPHVLALASRGAAIEVGTRHGLARVLPDSLRAEPLASAEIGAIRGLAVLRDTTWVGTESGVRVLSADGTELLMPRGVASASFARPVRQLAWAGDTLMVLTRDELFWRDADGVWTLGPGTTGALGELGYMAVDADGVWVVGDAAIGYLRPGLPAVPVLRPPELPGQVTAIAVDRDYLWIGTTRGVMRFRLDAIRP